MTPLITLEDLKAAADFDAAQLRIRTALDGALQSPLATARFFGRYTSWNGFFGSAVASLSGKIGRARGIFLDPAQPILLLADRSVYVASFFFDAARDEFDDRDSVHRDTHRCLAQSTLKGMLDFAVGQGHAVFADPVAMNDFFHEPEWLRSLNSRVAQGYGSATADEQAALFHSMGYHLGSELLADREFSLLDAGLRAKAPEMVAALKASKVNIAGQEHVAYQWLAIHSGHGGGAEADHFNWAVHGVELAFRFTPPTLHSALKREVLAGFAAFARDHHTFFTLVLED